MIEVGQRITQLRQRLGLNKQQFADAIGFARPLVSYVENGHRMPTVAMAVAIARRYNVTLDYIFAPMMGGK